MEDDAQSTTSELSPFPKSPFTQEEVDSVKGFVQKTREIDELRRRCRELNRLLKKDKEVLVRMLKERNKTKLKLENDIRIELVRATVQKKPAGPQIMEILQTTLQGEAAYSRVLPKIEESIRTEERESLVLDDPEKPQRKRKAPASG